MHYPIKYNRQNKMKKAGQLFIAALMILGHSFHAIAQDETDALRYSFLSPQGTARSLGFGSALGSIGGDFTSLSVNPAGIGVYRTSEFMVTPVLRFGSTDGRYLGETQDDSRIAFNFNNIGIVFTKAARGKRYEKSSWKSISFGIGVNRTADFNRNYTYGGLMKTSPGAENNSFSELFVNDAALYPGDVTTNGTLAYLGYQSYLTDEDSLGFYTVARSAAGLNQRRSVSEKGGISEIVFTLGGNYEEKLMLGATIGLPTVRYKRDAFFEETDASGDPANDFQSFRYSESLRTTGLGVNLKLGAIYRPGDNFRFGVAVHTPTWFSLNDEFEESLAANTQFGGVQSVSNDPLRFEYNLTTPWRGVLSATAFVGQYGFITADYEYVDYHSMRFRFSNDFKDEQTIRNEIIKNSFQAASNFRIGAEARIDKLFLRAGFGYYGNPYKNGSSRSGRKDFSVGAGFRSDKFFTDIAFIHSSMEQHEIAYSLPYVAAPAANLKNKMSAIALTFGWKME